MRELGIDLADRSPSSSPTNSPNKRTWSSPWAAATNARTSPASGTSTGTSPTRGPADRRGSGDPRGDRRADQDWSPSSIAKRSTRRRAHTSPRVTIVDHARTSSLPRKRHALELFAGLPRHYDRMGALLSFGQDPRWRRALVRCGRPAARPAGARRRDRHGDGRRSRWRAAARARSSGWTRARRCSAGARARLATRRPRSPSGSASSPARPSACPSPMASSTR